MIIKFNTLTSIIRKEEEIISKKLTKQDRIKGDRLVIVILFILTITLSVIFS